MNICVVAGARPNFVKVAPIILAVDKARNEGRDVSLTVVYAGCQDDPTLEASLFEDLQIPRPDVFLGVDCVSLNELTGRVMGEFEKYLQTNPTDVVIVVDDLASTMAAAIVTKKQGVVLAHLVAGTRSFDINMPKEINRLVIDGLSDLLFTAGYGSISNATREGAEQSKIFMVGNILMDTLRQNSRRFMRPEVLDKLHIADGEYLVFTINRKKLLADKENLAALMTAMFQSAGNKPIIAPLRSSAVEAIMPMALNGILPDGLPQSFHVVHSMGYLEFGYLTAHAAGIITDSGNVAEEATFNAVPCITLNSYTEHIETVKQGTNVLVGEDAALLQSAVADMVAGNWKQSSIPERWDGRTAERILQVINDYI
ncbi:MAG: UDP-N-acetylglucosamine 2-epimerase [Prevotella sp.]|nr:UDP-N-acetylglucosamine 2-epimerase [Prevotella sp.]MCR5152203.1 UDP-N-acetylglucosamine 2-epimerase [Prevotella sp.]